MSDFFPCLVRRATMRSRQFELWLTDCLELQVSANAEYIRECS